MKKEAKRLWAGTAGWFVREGSLTLVLWLALFLAVLIKWLYYK